MVERRPHELVPADDDQQLQRAAIGLVRSDQLQLVTVLLDAAIHRGERAGDRAAEELLLGVRQLREAGEGVRVRGEERAELGHRRHEAIKVGLTKRQVRA